MTQRAINSVFEQTHPAHSVSVFNDYVKRGAPFSRQSALEMNTHEWTAFLDSDDYFGKDHLEILAKAQEETNADYVYSWFWTEPYGCDPFPSTHFTEPWDNAVPRQTTITVLVRTELARAVGFWEPADNEVFPDGLRVGEDYIFTTGCMNLGGKIFHVPAKTWCWSHHGMNTSGRPDRGDAR